MANNTNTITLAGKDYPTPSLSVKQLRRVVPALVSLLKSLGSSIMLIQKAKNEGKVLTMDDLLGFMNLSEAQFDQFTTVIFLSISKGTPSLTQEEFDELPISMLEMFNAIPAIMNLTGLFDTTKQTTDAPAPGEAPPPSA